VKEPAVTLPKLSIAAKLYAIFALMATTTVALSVVAMHNAREHADLTSEFDSANAGSLNVERINGLIYAVQSAARGVVMSPDARAAAPFLADLGKSNDMIDKVFADRSSASVRKMRKLSKNSQFACLPSRISRPSSRA
jgi:hypothetical protein